MGLARKEESVHAGRSPRRELVMRFTLASASAGLLVGVFEAALLYFTPWVPTLYSSDVSYVIWFLAPLIDLTLFGLLGVTLGLLAAVGKTPSPARSVVLAATVLGMAGAHVAWSLDLVHVWVGDLRVVRHLSTPVIWFGAVFACALFLARLSWQGATRLSDAKRAWPLRQWAKALLTATALLVLALTIHLAKPFVGSVPTPAASSASLANPNIILITLDTVRADHLSTYGYSRPTTPNLDRLASQGVLFEDTIAPSSWTLPAHASIFTALLPHQHGANAYTPLDGSPRTLAEVLKSHGYETAGFIANGYGLSGWGLRQGFNVYDDNSSLLRHNLASTLVGRVLLQPLYHRFVRPDFYFRRTAAEINRDALRWFQHRPNRPFFLFINYFDAHDPHFVPEPYNKRFGKVSEAAVRRVSFGEGFPLRPPLSASEEDSLIAGYDNCLAYLDEQVGSLLQALALPSQESNTVVIITSDHGDAFGEHGMYLHCGTFTIGRLCAFPSSSSAPGFRRGCASRIPSASANSFPPCSIWPYPNNCRSVTSVCAVSGRRGSSLGLRMKWFYQS